MVKEIELMCDEEQRLDIFLSAELDENRSQIAQLLKQECVFIKGKLVTKAGTKLRDGDLVVVRLPEAESIEPQEIDFDVEIIYEDDDVLVINKPTDLTVHPAPSVKEPTLVDWLKHKGIALSTISGEERHGIVHRLDKGTSGAMVIAKNNDAHEKLSKQLQDKSMGRYYLAVVTPPLKEDIVEVDRAIGRSSHNRLKMACIEGAKEAKTHFAPLLYSHDESEQLIACKLFTGRTHQIRVHLEILNRHILGDHLYGSTKKESKTERILLHAYIIYFIHPSSGKLVSFRADFDEQFGEYLTKKFDKDKIYETTQDSYIISRFSTDY
ncbi:MAG: RluA family pseudouridine synthase [Epsilonproteobacteria bacterium]|nr:RluA family pseudouridine synthase [Campylobacterota bacterium]